MKPTDAVTIWRQQGAIWVRFPFNAEKLAALKTIVPSGYRRFDKRKKTWSIDRCYETTVLKFCADQFEHVCDIDRENNRDVPLVKKTPASPFHELICDQSEVVLEKIHDLILREYHAAGGADAVVAERVRLAWTAIKRERQQVGRTE